METFQHKGTTITVKYWDPRKTDPTRLFPISPEHMATVISMCHTKEITNTSAKELIGILWKAGRLRWLAEDVLKGRVRIVEDINAQ